jgi:hypothetical protein
MAAAAAVTAAIPFDLLRASKPIALVIVLIAFSCITVSVDACLHCPAPPAGMAGRGSPSRPPFAAGRGFVSQGADISWRVWRLWLSRLQLLFIESFMLDWQRRQ